MAVLTDLSVSRSSRRSSLPSVVTSVVFGTAAGIVGTLVVFAYFVPGITPNVVFPTRDGNNQESVPEFISQEAFSTARRAAVSLVVTKAATAPLGGAYAPGEATGAGMVLTSDGWIVTTAPVSAVRPQDTSAIIGGEVYPVRRVVVDSYSGVRFLKVDAANLPVNAFAEADQAVGDALYMPDAAGGASKQLVRLRGLLPATATDGLVRSSEQLQQAMFIPEEPMLAGTMVLNVEGQAVGLIGEATPFGRTVIPVNAFSDAMDDVLRDGRANRPVLGVNYLDLSAVRVAEGPSRGALVTASPDGRRLAVARRSPAESSGIRQGDIITAVDGDLVTADNPLSAIVARHAVGESATFTVERGRLPAEISVTVTFGAAQ